MGWLKSRGGANARTFLKPAGATYYTPAGELPSQSPLRSNTFSYFPRLDPFHVRLPFQSLPTGVPDDRLKLRVTIDQKYQQVPIDLQREKQPLVSNGNLSAQSRRQGVSICPQQLTPPAKVFALCQPTKYIFGFGIWIFFPTALYVCKTPFYRPCPGALFANVLLP